MDNHFNINRRKFISTGAALSLGIPFMEKTIEGHKTNKPVAKQ